MAFRYVAVSPAGDHVQGLLDAPSESQAERALWDANYKVITLRKQTELPGLEKIFPSLFAVKKRALINLSRQLATLLESGVPVMRSLELLEAQATSKPLARAMHAIARDVRGGSTFADAIRQHTAVFPPVYSRMIELGERTGRIEEMLRQLADYMEREEAVARRVRSALAYPSFILLLALGVAALLMTTALPALTSLFDEFEGDLPITTRLLVGTSSFLGAHRMQILGLILLAIVAGAWFFQRPAGKRTLDRAVITLPVIRDVTLSAHAARLSRTLALMLRAGLPLTEAMDMLVRMTDNGILRGKVEGVSRQLIDGEGLSAPLGKAGCYPPMLVQMVAVGEETGTLDGNLTITADFYSREVDSKVDALAGMLAPALTIIVGLIVGFVALSLIMPMYQLIGDINQVTQNPPPPAP